MERDNFAIGEEVWVHDTRFPYTLRRATVSRLDHAGIGPVTFAVETGLGGTMHTEPSEMHHKDDRPPVAGCSYCAGDPNAARSPKGD